MKKILSVVNLPVTQKLRYACNTRPAHNYVVLFVLFFLFSGLIIDAFGELRDQQEQVKKDMEVRFDNWSFTHCVCVR